MAFEDIAVNGMTLVFDPVNPVDVILGTITVTGSPSTKGLANSLGIYKNGLTVTVSGVTVPSAGAVIPDPLSQLGSFIATTVKTKLENLFVLRENDVTGVLNATPQIPAVVPVPYPVAFRIKILTAGQIKVRSN